MPFAHLPGRPSSLCAHTCAHVHAWLRVQDLIEKIAQLNASIDDVAAQLKVKEAEPVKADASA